jgi:hypothetical protein
VIGTFSNILKIPELKRRIIITFLLLAVYRIGVHVPTPGINADALASFFAQARGTLFGLFDMFTGGALEKFSVFALGIMPYISASIIMELLSVVIPYIDRLKKEGESGRKKIVQYTRYGTVLLSLIQPDDDDYPHGGNRIHHVAGGADYGKGNRQRDFPYHLCGNRGETARCLRQYHSADEDGGVTNLFNTGHPCLHGRGSGVYHFHGNGSEAIARSICKTDRRTEGLRGAKHSSSLKDQYLGGYSPHLRLINIDVSLDHRSVYA